MTSLSTIAKFLNKELEVSNIKDSSVNGVQVKGKKIVNKIAFGVDASLEIFRKAKQKKCDMIIVHHGIKWKGQKSDKRIKKDRIDFLKKNHLTLYAAHLPLDRHEKFGNNIKIAELIGLKSKKRFGFIGGKAIGYYGDMNIKLSSLVKKIDKKLNTKSLVYKDHEFVKRIGIISGGGSEFMEECIKKGIDTYLTGETKHSAYHNQKEYKINVIYAGHYKTECTGVKALQIVIKEKFNIETEFIDIPTGL